MKEWQKDRILYNITQLQKQFLHDRFIDKYFDVLEVDNYRKELVTSETYQQLISKRTSEDLSYKGTPYILYAIIRKFKPNIVVETGVDHGFSSTVILYALHKNNKGKLISIDIALHDFCGEYVPEHLKDRWTFIKGKTTDILPTINEDIDIFFHDSDHHYDTQYFEYEWAWQHMKSKGILTSHDIGASNAFFNFAMDNKVNYYTIKTTGNMYRFGIIVKE